MFGPWVLTGVGSTADGPIPVATPAPEQATGGWGGRRGFAYTREEYESLVRRVETVLEEQPQQKRKVAARRPSESIGLVPDEFRAEPSIIPPAAIPAIDHLARILEQRIAERVTAAQKKRLAVMLETALAEAAAAVARAEAEAVAIAMAEADEEDAITALLLTI